MTETSSVKASRIRWTSAERMAWLDLFRTSEQSAAEFCSVNDLPYATFSLWLRQSEPAQDGGEGETVEVPVTELLNETVSTAAVHVHLPSGARLKIVPGTDPAWLAQLVRALASVGG